MLKKFFPPKNAPDSHDRGQLSRFAQSSNVARGQVSGFDQFNELIKKDNNLSLVRYT
jgi:hypothetical protein